MQSPVLVHRERPRFVLSTGFWVVVFLINVMMMERKVVSSCIARDGRNLELAVNFQSSYFHPVPRGLTKNLV